MISAGAWRELRDLLHALPAGKDQQLMQALIELLLSAASAPPAAEGENHEPQADR